MFYVDWYLRLKRLFSSRELNLGDVSKRFVLVMDGAVYSKIKSEAGIDLHLFILLESFLLVIVSALSLFERWDELGVISTNTHLSQHIRINTLHYPYI